MTQDIEKLLLDSVRELRGRSLAPYNGDRPEYPVCVFYYGRASAKYHGELAENLATAWGAAADDILYICVDDPSEGKMASVPDRAALDTDAFLRRLTRTLEAGGSFVDATRIAAYAVFDTAEIDGAEAFEAWYRFIARMQGIFDGEGYSARAMLLLVNDQSAGRTKASKAIKSALHALFEDPETGGKDRHLYESVFFLSNRRSNNTMAYFNPARDDYAADRILTDIILLSNTGGYKYSQARARLCNSAAPACTMAYNYAEKPIRKILMAILQKILARLAESAENDAGVSAEALADALGLKNSLAATEAFWQSVAERLDPSFFHYLPNAGSLSLSDSYDAWEKATFGCLGAFLEENHYRRIEDEAQGGRSGHLANIEDILAGRFLAPSLQRGVNRDVTQEVRERSMNIYVAGGAVDVRNAVANRCKLRFTRTYCELLNQALSAAAQRAKALMDAFAEVRQEIGNIASNEFAGAKQEDRDFRAFYEAKADAYLNDQNMRDLRAKVFDIRGGREDMLDALRSLLREITGFDPVFRQSFMEELVARLGAKANEKQAMEDLRRELIGNLSDRLSFYFNNAAQNQRLFLEAYFFNNASENALYTLLKASATEAGVEKALYDTSNSSSIESMWFYALEKESLLEN